MILMCCNFINDLPGWVGKQNNAKQIFCKSCLGVITLINSKMVTFKAKGGKNTKS